MTLIKWMIAVLFLASSFALAIDEEDIPPPPMPEYMKKANFEAQNKKTMPPSQRELASEEAPKHLDSQTEEEVKNEFLQAGEDTQDLEEDVAVQKVQEGSIEEAAEQEVASSPPEVFEEVDTPTPIEEVSEVAVAEKEFEQAEMNPKSKVQAATHYQKDVGNEPAQQPEQELANQEKLADMEEKLEEAEQEAEETLARAPSSKNKFKAGMYKFDKTCKMYSEPSSMSDQAGSIRPGRKLWIDAHDANWHKAYKKSGTVYISSDCLQQ